MILCIVGPSCAGKTTSSEYICSKTEFQFIEASDYVRQRYRDSNYDGEIIRFVTEEFEAHGKDTFAKNVVADIDEDDVDVIVCGFRAKEEVDLLNRTFNDVLCIGIYANCLLRYQRKLQRDGQSAIGDYASFVKKDFKEYTFGISVLMDQYIDLLIMNEGTLGRLYSTLDSEVITKRLNECSVTQ